MKEAQNSASKEDGYTVNKFQEPNFPPFYRLH